MPSPRLLLNDPMTFTATAYTFPLRILVAALLLLGRATLLVLAALVFLAPEPITPAQLLRAFWLLVAAPEAAVWILRYLLRAQVSVDQGAVVVRLRTRRAEIPLSAFARIVPWSLPLPAPGLWLELRSGARYSDGLHIEDPAAFLDALKKTAAADLAEAVSRHPTMRYAAAKHRAASRLDRPLLKYGFFSLVPAVPIFRLRQRLVYGGTFGEYYDHGLKAYLLGFGIYWVLYGVYLLLYAAVLRALAEGVSLGAAWLAPSYALGARRSCEIIQRLLYFVGVPVVLILRFIPW